MKKDLLTAQTDQTDQTDQRVSLKLEYQACNDESCMPPDVISVPLRLKMK